MAQLRLLVGKEADAALAGGAVRAQLRAVAIGVEPALEDAVGEGAGVAASTLPGLAVLRTGRARVGKPPGVPAFCLFTLRGETWEEGQGSGGARVRGSTTPSNAITNVGGIH